MSNCQTAYNTYVIDGLPPGPIANPGRAALEAVANPAQSNALYFVADGTGGHVFSDSLDAHNRNVQHLREIEQNNKAALRAAMVERAGRSRSAGRPRRPFRTRAGAGSGVAALPSKFIARALRLANLAGGHVLTGLLDARKQDIRRWRGIEREYKAERNSRQTLRPAATAARRSADASVRAPPGASEFAARHDLAPQQPRLQPDSRMMARVAPLLPGAPPPPRRVTDFDPDRAGASASPHFAALGDVEMGGITRAENELDGPADEPAPDASPAQQAAAGDLDGPAEPVQTGRVGGALGYAGGLVNAAPNGKPRIFDAAAGTALDPLLEKNWDLDNAQTVDVPASEADAAKSQTAAKSRTATRKTKAKVKAKVLAKAKARLSPRSRRTPRISRAFARESCYRRKNRLARAGAPRRRTGSQA